MFTPIYLLLNLFGLIGVAFALWKGRAAERLGAVIVLCNLAVGVATDLALPGSEAVVLLCNDGIAALALLAVTLRYAAPWMGGVMLFYATQFSLHAFYMVMERPTNDYVHALVNNIDFIGIVSCLIIGAAFAWRQRLRLQRAQLAPAEAAP